MFIIGQFWLLSSFYFRIQDDIATSSRNSDSHSDRKKENLINHALGRVLPLCDMYHLTSHSTGQSGLKASHTMHWTGELWSPFPNCKDTICTILLMHNNTFHHQSIMEKIQLYPLLRMIFYFLSCSFMKLRFIQSRSYFLLVFCFLNI